MSLPDQDLQCLLGRYLRDDDEDAMAELVSRTRPRLLAAARRIGRPQDAEDSVQAAYHSLVRSGELPPNVPILGWLMTATVRIAFRQKALHARDHVVARKLVAGSCDWQGTPDAPSAAQAASRQEDLASVRRAVHRLPAGYREPVVLFYLQQLSIDQTAQLMGIPASTVATRLQRARALLRSRLSPGLLTPLLVWPWWILDARHSGGPAAAKVASVALAGAAAVTILVAVAVPSAREVTASIESSAVAAGTVPPGPRPAASVREAPRSSPPAHIEEAQPVTHGQPVVEGPPPARQPADAPPPGASIPVEARAETPIRIVDERQATPPAAPPAELPTPRVSVVRPAPRASRSGAASTGHPEDAWVTPDADQDATAQSQLDALHQALQLDAATGFLALLDAGLERWERISSYQTVLYLQERREGRLRPQEVVGVRFHKPYCIHMRWRDSGNEDKHVLYVLGRYQDKLNLQVRKLFLKLRLQRDPADPAVLENTNHPITEASFGQILRTKRTLTEQAIEERGVTVEYGGIVRHDASGRSAFRITRVFDWPATAMRRCVDWIDAATLMPLESEVTDGEGFLESYTWRSTRLDPTLGGRPLLTASSFHRSNLFPEDAEWGKELETWTFSDLETERR